MIFDFKEYLGLAASLVVLISFLMKNVRTLRMINSVGCLLFVAYGFMLWSFPIMITNVAIACINIYYLTKRN